MPRQNNPDKNPILKRTQYLQYNGMFEKMLLSLRYEPLNYKGCIMAKTGDKLTRLLEQEREIQAAIKEAKKEQAKQNAELHKKRGEIIGLAVLSEMEESEAFAATIQGILDKRVTISRDRKALGLAPLKKEKQPEPA